MPVYTVVTANAKPAVLLNVYRQPDSNTVIVANAIHEEVEKIQEGTSSRRGDARVLRPVDHCGVGNQT